MARLSASNSNARYAASGRTSEEQSVSAEGVADSEEEEEEEEGAMEEHATPKRRRLNADARHSNGNTSRPSHQRAMGQEESRETVRGRNAALHSAGQEARQPKRGQLKRVSAGPSNALSARRIPLANGNTYDVQDDNDDDVFPINARHTPLRRIVQRTQQPSYKSPEQLLLDQQLREAADNEDGDVEQEEEEAESEGREQEEPAVEQPQQSGSGKKGRGRPRKSIQLNADGKRRPGRPSRHNQPDNQRRQPSIQPSTSGAHSPEATAEHGNSVTPDTTTAPARKRGRPTREEAAAAAARASSSAQRLSNGHAQANVRRSGRVSGEMVEPTTESVVPAASTSAASQPSNHANRAGSNNGRRPNIRETIVDDEHQQATQGVDSVAQPVVIDDDQDDGQAQNADEEPDEAEEEQDDEDDDDDDDDDDAQENEEERPATSEDDSGRLFGHWESIHELMQEAAKYRDERPSTRDKMFKTTLRDCKRARRTVRATAMDIDSDELEHITSECKNAVDRAARLCGDTSQVRGRDNRGVHIFRFLMPALVRLLTAVIEAFERCDIDGAGLPQISTDHFSDVINLMHAIWSCGDNAYHTYTGLSEPIKREVHKGITLALRALLDKLTEFHNMKLANERAKERAEALHQELEARNEQRERVEQRRKTERTNQEKWKKMNSARWEVSKNSMNQRKLDHLRSCPMALVETDMDGQPFLPAYLRKRVKTFTMSELAALEEGLRKHVDTPSPLQSEVFENLMREYCRYGRELAEKNTLEIVRQANDLRAGLIKLHKDNGTEPPRWVWRVPVWMPPVRY